ncbi:Rieske 2Fe-2S domain-containing protein [Mycobacterium sp. NPDC003449]
MASPRVADREQANVMILPGEGYHQCWYPVALSEEIPTGRPIGMEFCDDRIVLFRGDDGIVRTAIPYCKHMGSDLSSGAVVGNELRCAFHHWHYGPDGRCSNIPSGDRIPSNANLTMLPTEESRGLVWVFLGTTPLYPVPELVEWDPETITTRTLEVPFDEPLKVDPWIFASNAFDYQHLRVLHSSPIDADAASFVVNEHSIDSAFKMSNPHGGELDWNLQMFGTNSLISHGKREGQLTQHIGAGAPLGGKGTKFYLILTTAAAGVDGRTEGDVEADFEVLAKMHFQLFNEDLPVLNSLRPGANMFVRSDRTLAQYLRYARGYPRTTLRELEFQNG